MFGSSPDFRESIFDSQHSLTFFDLVTNETTDLPPFWQLPATAEMLQGAKLTLAAGASSLAMSIAVVAIYYRAIMYPANNVLAHIVNPHNHFIFLIQLSAVFSSLMFIVTAALRLWGTPRHSYLWCDTSFVIAQVFVEPQVTLEMFFLLAIVVSIYKPNWLPRKQKQSSEVPPFVFYSSCASFCVSIASAFSCIAWLPLDPYWGTRGNPTSVAWCWIPARYPDQPIDDHSTRLIVAQFLSFFAWVFVCPVAGLVAVCLGWKAMYQPTSAVKWFFRFRLAYVVIFTVFGVFPMLSRINNDPDSRVHSFQAFCEPFVPFINGAIFLLSEALPRYYNQRVFNGAELGRRSSSGLGGTGPGDGTDSSFNPTDQSLLDGIASPTSEASPLEGKPTETNNEDSAAIAASAASSNVGQSSHENVHSLQHGPLPSEVSLAGSPSVPPAPSNQQHHQKREILPQHEVEDLSNANLSTVSFGVGAVMLNLSHHDRVLFEQKQHEAQADNIRVVFDEITQSWTIDVDPTVQVSAESVIAKLQAIKFIQVDTYIFGAILSFLCGFGDLAGAALLHFFTAHVTGNIASWALYVGGFETKVGLLRHGWGYLVFAVGAGLCAEFFRRNQDKKTAARMLLVWTWFFLLASFIAARTHENIGSKAWDDSSASWVSSFCMVLAFAGTNVYQRVANTGPIFTLQTGNTTALSGDIFASIFALPDDAEQRKVLLRRMRGNFLNIASFTGGAVVSCICAQHRAELCFAIPAFLSTICLWFGWGIHT